MATDSLRPVDAMRDAAEAADSKDGRVTCRWEPANA
jgi:hypothetical protein